MARPAGTAARLAIQAAGLTLAVALGLVPAGRAFCGPTTQGTTLPESAGLTPQQRAELEISATTLRDKARSLPDRVNHARLLLMKSWPEAEAVLLDVLGNRDEPNGRLAVASALAMSATGQERVSPKFMDPLIAVLDDPNEALRKESAKALAMYRDNPVLLERFRGIVADAGRNIELRRGAVVAISHLPPSPASIEPLMQVLDEGPASLRPAAFEALQRQTQAGLGSDPAAWKQWWAENSDKSTLDLQVEAYQRLAGAQELARERQQEVERRLAETLEQLYEATEPTKRGERVVAYLKDPLPAVRVKGLELIDRMIASQNRAPEPVARAALELLADRTSPAEVRAAAADVAPFLGEPPQMVDELLKALDQEQRSLPRQRIVRALGHRQLRAAAVAEAVPALVQQLGQSPDPAVAEAAARALGAIGGTAEIRDVDPIVAGLRDRYAGLGGGVTNGLREALVTAMADVADPRFAQNLLAELANEQATIRLAAARGLGRIGSAAQAPAAEALVGRLAVETDRDVRMSLLDSLTRFKLAAAQLDAVYAQTTLPKEDDIRKKAWSCLVSLLKPADKTAVLSWAKRIEGSTDPAAAPYLVELLRSAEARAAQEKWPEAGDIVERLGDALVRAKLNAEAARRFQQTYEKCVQDKSPRTETVALKLLNCQLADGQGYQAVKLLNERLEQGGDKAGPLADAIIAHLRGLVDGPNPAAAADMIGVIRKTIPSERLGQWAKPLDRLASRADQRVAQQVAEQVGRALDGMTGGDAPAQAAARTRIEKLGLAAAPALLDELDACINAGDAQAVRERAIISLLANPPICAKDYDPAAPTEQKKACVAAYRQRLKNPPANPE